ncbi:MAG: hypothetical protein ACM31O_03905 [Bacteroidota bacterium]
MTSNAIALEERAVSQEPTEQTIDGPPNESSGKSESTALVPVPHETASAPPVAATVDWNSNEEINRGLVDLLEMLSYRRPHKSKSERRFIRRFIRPLGVQQDEYGNLYKVVGEKPNILWSCHTDTVHRDGGRQRLYLDRKEYTLRLDAREKKSNCLGADDGAGVWLMREMIRAGVPGLYVFHRNEEHGCKGSNHIARTKTLLSGIEIAIAFDRRNTGSVITFQHGGRCCSDTFAAQLAGLIGLGHALDDGGVYTDTAEYTELVSECTNLSIGYSGEHTAKETLNVIYLFELRERMLSADFSQLRAVRDPASKDYRWGNRYTHGWDYDFGDYTAYPSYTAPNRAASIGPGAIRSKPSVNGMIYDRTHGWLHEDLRQKTPSYLRRPSPADEHDDDDPFDSVDQGWPPRHPDDYSVPDLWTIAREYPEHVADYLDQLGVSAELLWDHICQVNGTI